MQYFLPVAINSNSRITKPKKSNYPNRNWSKTLVKCNIFLPVAINSNSRTIRFFKNELLPKSQLVKNRLRKFKIYNRCCRKNRYLWITVMENQNKHYDEPCNSLKSAALVHEICTADRQFCFNCHEHSTILHPFFHPPSLPRFP